MIRAHELARLLLAGPNAVVTTWQNETRQPVEGSDSDVEQVVVCENARDGGLTVVIGLDIPANDLAAETLWGQS